MSDADDQDLTIKVLRERCAELEKQIRDLHKFLDAAHAARDAFSDDCDRLEEENDQLRLQLADILGT